MSLGLKYLVSANTSELADLTVYGTDPLRICQRPGICFERAREEVVKAGVMRDVSICRLVHVHVITLNKPTDNGVRQASPMPIRKTACEFGQGLFR